MKLRNDNEAKRNMDDVNKLEDEESQITRNSRLWNISMHKSLS